MPKPDRNKLNRKLQAENVKLFNENRFLKEAKEISAEKMYVLSVEPDTFRNKDNFIGIPTNILIIASDVKVEELTAYLAGKGLKVQDESK